MSLKVVLPLVVAFVFICFALFNVDVVTINLIGQKSISLPISILVFFVFLAGAFFAAALAFQTQVEQARTISKLKKRVKTFVADARSTTGRAAEEAFIEVPPPAAALPEQTPDTANIPFQKMKLLSRPDKPQNGIMGTTDGKAVTLDDRTVNDDEENKLSPKLREIALRIIKNG